MVALSALNINSWPPIGLQYLTSFVAITGTDFPALSVVTWDYSPLDGNPPGQPISAVQIMPRYAQLVYVVNQ